MDQHIDYGSGPLKTDAQMDGYGSNTRANRWVNRLLKYVSMDE